MMMIYSLSYVELGWLAGAWSLGFFSLSFLSFEIVDDRLRKVVVMKAAALI